MASKASYASKTDLLEWVNGVLGLQLSKLEQLASGAVFCQLLDAFYPNSVAIHKVNFFAREEYEAAPNYKQLQSAFVVQKITKEINISKLCKGSRVDILELVQFLYKALSKLQPTEGYDPHERRALSVKGGTDAVPIPGSMTASFDNFGGRSGFRTSSGNWNYAVEPQPLRSSLRASGTLSAVAPSPARSTCSTPRKQCTPLRQPTHAPQHPAASTPKSAARAMSRSTSRADKVLKPEHEEPSGVAVSVLNVVEQDNELSASTCQLQLEASGVSRLVIPTNVMENTVPRPMSPGVHSLMDNTHQASLEALAAVRTAMSAVSQIRETLGCSTDGYGFRGKIRSLQDALQTLMQHITLLLADRQLILQQKAVQKESSEVIQKDVDEDHAALRSTTSTLKELLQSLNEKMDSTPVVVQFNIQLSQMQKELTTTTSLDSAIRSVGAAEAALLQRLHRESALTSSHFLDVSDVSGSEETVASTTQVLRLGDLQMKRLKNGDVYKGQYVNGRKGGHGMYLFVNGDVYEGEFKEDKMSGHGMYTFSPEGRYEGEWNNAMYEGAGSETFAKGSTYRGQYEGGVRSGWGVCRFYNGDYYEGQWLKGLREGRGMQQCTDDSNYIGDYQKGKRHGHGVYSFPNGDQYLGEYAEDIPHGYGVYVFGTGQKYEGHWERGKKDGWSVYTVETGQRWAGHWSEGKPLWVHPLPDGWMDGEPPSGTAAELHDNLKLGWVAQGGAKEASKLAQQRAVEHFTPGGEIQKSISMALQLSTTAVAGAEASRGQVQEVAHRLDIAAHLVDQGRRDNTIKVASGS